VKGQVGLVPEPRTRDKTAVAFWLAETRVEIVIVDFGHAVAMFSSALDRP
jgi:hypothetical protein